MTRNQKIAVIVIVGAVLVFGAAVASFAFILKRSGVCALTALFDNKFGDQHMKTSVALLELYKDRHGRYPDQLSDLDFVGDWDRLALASVVYYPNEERTRYYLEVTRGWLCSPSLRYPKEFWSGTGYDASSKPR
jgi:hypothetical protein